MILGLIAASVIAATPVDTSLSEAEHAIDVGRVDQARMMISRAMSAGASGPAADRLLADLAFATGQDSEALARYQRLLAGSPRSTYLCEHAGIAALRLGDVVAAAPLIDCATNASNASWRAWNAKGAIADFKRDWAAADQAYSRARDIAPNSAALLNNEGWSLLMRGDWQRAVDLLERASALDPRNERIANNLELARCGIADSLPKRRDGESGREWAERLNDAGVAAEIRGDRQRALAAFAQAMEVSENWYERAANNLKAASGK